MRMAEIGEGSTDTRRRAGYDELITRSTDMLVIDTVISILVDARLVITSTLPPESTRVVEVAHEALIREWPTLREWLNEDRQGRILHQRLIEDTGEWIKLDRDPGRLYRGAKLNQASDWADKNAAFLSLQEQEFLEASHILEEKEAEQARRLARASRLQRVFIALTAILILAVSYLVYTFIYDIEPAKMSGFYNIALAEFPSVSGELNQGALVNSDLTQQLYDSLKDQLQEYPNILIWHDSPELEDLNVKVGAVQGENKQQRVEAAESLAARLNADMVIYGVINFSNNPRNSDWSFTWRRNLTTTMRIFKEISSLDDRSRWMDLIL